MEAQPTGNFLYDTVLPKVLLIDWLVACLGLVLRLFFLLPGGDTLVMVGLGGLAVVYFLRAFEPYAPDEITDTVGLNYTPNASVVSENRLTVLVRYLQAFGSMLAICGILFKFLFWRGAAFMLPVGILMLVLVIAWQSSIGTLRRQTILIAGLGIFAWLVPTEALLRQRYPDDPALVTKMLYQDQHPRDKAATLAVRQAMAAWRKRPHQHSRH